MLLLQVQNADDNAYHANAAPALELVLNERSIVLLNNEAQGFQEKDMVSLCDAGNSSKKGVSGYTGKQASQQPRQDTMRRTSDEAQTCPLAYHHCAAVLHSMQNSTTNIQKGHCY